MSLAPSLLIAFERHTACHLNHSLPPCTCQEFNIHADKSSVDEIYFLLCMLKKQKYMNACINTMTCTAADEADLVCYRHILYVLSWKYQWHLRRHARAIMSLEYMHLWVCWTQAFKALAKRLSPITSGHVCQPLPHTHSWIPGQNKITWVPSTHCNGSNRCTSLCTFMLLNTDESRAFNSRTRIQVGNFIQNICEP